jgi:hypothetical protein
MCSPIQDVHLQAAGAIPSIRPGYVSTPTKGRERKSSILTGRPSNKNHRKILWSWSSPPTLRRRRSRTRKGSNRKIRKQRRRRRRRRGHLRRGRRQPGVTSDRVFACPAGQLSKGSKSSGEFLRTAAHARNPARRKGAERMGRKGSDSSWA